MFNVTPFKRNNDLITGNLFWDDFDKFFNNFFDESIMSSFIKNDASINVNIKETENAYEVEAQVPGVSKEEIKLDIENDILTISVNHKEEVNEENENYLRREHRVLNMNRSFRLGNVNKDDIKAKLENGILNLKLPKKEISKPETKSIEIE